jgi:hypothetical protein
MTPAMTRRRRKVGMESSSSFGGLAPFKSTGGTQDRPFVDLKNT